GDLTAFSLFFWLSRTHRQFPMQTQVDGLRLHRRIGVRLRGTALLILAASLVGTVAAWWAYLHTLYSVGYETANFYPGMISSCGAAVVLFLSFMRGQFIGWPFHPAGYIASGHYGLMRLWLPIFVTWLVKSLLLRYGGLPAYRRALPLFFGLVLGEFSAGFLRTVL